MSEHRLKKERYRETPEDNADKLLARGKLSDARDVLFEMSKKFSDSNAFYHAATKLFALPLYELAYYPPNEDRLRATDPFYPSMASLLELDLATRNTYPPDSEQQRYGLGRISEQTFLLLAFRDELSPDTNAILVPSSRQADKRSNIDFHFSPIGTGKIDDGLPIQIKTSPTEKDRKECARDSILLIGMNELDPYATNPSNPRSLANCILRDVDGTATDDDHKALDAAFLKIHNKMAEAIEPDLGHSGAEILHRKMANIAHRLVTLNPLPRTNS